MGGGTSGTFGLSDGGPGLEGSLLGWMRSGGNEGWFGGGEGDWFGYFDD